MGVIKNNDAFIISKITHRTVFILYILLTMMENILKKISFFAALVFGLGVLSWCGTQSSVASVSSSQQTTATNTSQQQPQVQVNTTTRAS